MSTADLITLLVFIVALPVIIYFDIREQRIHNAITFPLAALGLLFGALTNGIPGFTDHVWGALIAGGVWFILWLLGIMGGGDQKLMMLCGAWLGKDGSLILIIAVAILGGLQALIWIAARRLRTHGTVESRELWRQTTLPYSIPIALAALGISFLKLLSL